MSQELRINEQQWSRTHRWVISTDCGSIQLEIYTEPRGEDKVKAYIWALWVDETARRKGLASTLLRKAEEIAKSQGEPYVWLEWEKTDSEYFVIEWYQRQGYDEVAFGPNNSLLRKSLLTPNKSAIK